MARLIALIQHALTATVTLGWIACCYLWVAFRIRILELPLSAAQWELLNRRMACHYRRAALRCKGGLIKLGQFVSARVDVVPPEVVEELTQLQDQVEAVPYAEVAERIRCELGADPEQLFQSFSREAVAAASFGQVHRAVLEDGRVVAVKVRHRDIHWSLSIDLFLFRLLVWLFDVLLEKVALSRVYDELANALREELRYDLEARNCEQIRVALRDNPGVFVPAVIEHLSTPRLLVMDFVEGQKITDLDSMARYGVEPAAVCRRLIEAYIQQIYVHGFFQSDPHPGNLFCLPDGRVGIVDFGQTKALPIEVQRNVRRAVFAVVTRNPEGFTDACIALNFIEPEGREAFREVVLSVGEELESFSPSELASLDYPALVRTCWSFLGRVDGVVIPHDLVLYGRTLGLLHGLASLLDPEINVVQLARPYLLRSMLNGA